MRTADSGNSAVSHDSGGRPGRRGWAAPAPGPTGPDRPERSGTLTHQPSPDPAIPLAREGGR